MDVTCYAEHRHISVETIGVDITPEFIKETTNITGAPYLLHSLYKVPYWDTFDINGNVVCVMFTGL